MNTSTSTSTSTEVPEGMPQPGTLATVRVVTRTVTEAGTTTQIPTIHGRVDAYVDMASIERRHTPGSFHHVLDSPQYRAAGAPPARKWVRIESATGGPNPELDTYSPLAFNKDSSITVTGALLVCVDSDDVTLTPITDEGAAWVEANLTPGARKDALLAQFAAINPDAAAKLNEAIEDMVSEAHESGSHSGWMSAYSAQGAR